MEPQPRFPTYVGPPLPKMLNPLNLRHYGLVLMWAVFQPSSLLHYLWESDSDLYRQRGVAIFKTLFVPAYLTLYSQVICLMAALFSALNWLEGTPVDWGVMVRGVALISVMVVAGGIAVGWAGGVPNGMLTILTGGVTIILAAIVLDVVTFVIVGEVAGDMSGSAGLGMWFGMWFGVVFGVAGGAAFGVAFGVVIGVVSGVMFGMTSGVAGSVAVGVAGGVAGSRLLFYPLEFFLSLLPSCWQKHAVLWSDLAIWPLPQTNQFLYHQITQSTQPHWPAVQKVAANPFQRGHVQRALSNWLRQDAASLARLYQLVEATTLDEYITTPALRRHFEHWPSAKVVLLTEIGQQFIAATSDDGDTSEKIVWWLTRRYRLMKPAPLVSLAALLGELLYRQGRLQEMEVAVLRKEILAPERYEPAHSLQQGNEIADSFATMRAALGCQTVDDLATCAASFRWLDSAGGELLRPAVVDALRGLRDISQHAAHFQQRSNAAHQTTLLNLAAGQLNELQAYVSTEVPLPERGLLARIVEIWQDIIAAAQGELARTSLQQMSRAERRQIIRAETTATLWQRPAAPYDNPYVAGDPVYPPLFVGRRDIFNRISEVWSAKANPDSIILYGHRRMGKSSILRNLDQVAPPGSLIVYADMMGETSFVESTADLLFTLADKIFSAVRQHRPTADLTDPNSADYSSPSQAQRQFNRLASQVQTVLGDQTLILALDEFEAVEAAVAAGKIGREIYQFLRTKTQERWLTLVFGGLHTLDEMSRDYQQPFYGSYSNIPVSYLPESEARVLITNPTAEFQLTYEQVAVDKIMALSGGQPYLIQQLCRDAVNQLNHALFDNNERRDGVVTVADVEATLGDAVFQRGMVYFDGVWRQTENKAQRQLLLTLARREAAWSLAEMSAATGLAEVQLAPLLRWAERQDILQKQGEAEPRWSFYVPLLRQWLARRS
ncbi:MAG: ATP-binding protein [Anaerolineales bacterium]|nr:ATP-binding protein [Anaerolineales bacterium]